MNEAPVMIDIDRINSNPFQMRQAEDPAAVAELAFNIKRNGLLQPPTVRRVIGPNGIFELVFGHTRLAAFRLLDHEKGDGVPTEFSHMPCFVRELDDLQMFEMAVAENIKRRDLNPIERAQAMQTYMNRFMKTSAETGEFFNVDESTVRGSIRLLGLSEPVQVKLSSGEITVGAARQLLILQKVEPKSVEKVTERIIAGGDPAKEIVEQLRCGKNTQVMQERYEARENPLAGDGLWRLDLDRFPDMPHLTSAFAQDAGAIDKEAGKHKKDIQDWINLLEGGLMAPEALAVAELVPVETVERLAHLINPPACNKCAYYVQSDGTHICTWKVCWHRKMLWMGQVEAEKISKKLDIPIYDPETDGEYVELKEDYNEKHKKAFKDHGPGLRLRFFGGAKSYGKFPFTNSKMIYLVDVSPQAVQKEKDEQAEQERMIANRDENEKKKMLERQLQAAKSTAAEKFLEQAVLVFTPVLDVIQNEKVLLAIAGTQDAYFDSNDDDEVFDEDGKVIDERKYIQFIRRFITREMLDTTVEHGWWDLSRAGPLAVAEHLVTVAREWEVDLPSDWLERARAFEATVIPEEQESDREEADDDVGEETIEEDTE